MRVESSRVLRGPTDLWWSLFQQHKQSLKHQVRESRADGDVIQQALDVVDHNAAELGLVGIIKHLEATNKPRQKGRTDGEEAEGNQWLDQQQQAGRIQFSLSLPTCEGLECAAALTFLIAWHLEISECPIILSGEQILMKGNCESSAILAASAVFPL